jgi:hypothetical protein
MKNQDYTLFFLLIILLFMLGNLIFKTKLEFFENQNEVVEIDDSLFKEYEKLKEQRKELNVKLGADNEPEISVDEIKKYEGEGTYKRIPLPNNSILLEDDMDEGILKNYRIFPQTNTWSQEIFFEDMNKIVNTILYAGSFNLYYDEILDLNGDLKKNEIHNLIANNLVFVINNAFKIYKMNNEKHKYDKREYKLLNFKVINDSEIKGLSSNNRNFIFNIKFYKDDKDYNYALQTNCNYDFLNRKVTYLNIDIIGINEQEKIKLNNPGSLKGNYCRVDKKYNGTVKTCFRDELDNNISLEKFEKNFTENDVKKYLNEKKKEEIRHKDSLKYKCFLKQGFNKSTCESYDFKTGNLGVYDKPCVRNEECPFYKKNTNYENTRGGCINGYCEMPVNIERVGYKNYRKSKKPFCHNCNRKGCLGDDCFTCCDDQDSPDYMFSNDLNARKDAGL